MTLLRRNEKAGMFSSLKGWDGPLQPKALVAVRAQLRWDSGSGLAGHTVTPLALASSAGSDLADPLAAKRVLV